MISTIGYSLLFLTHNYNTLILAMTILGMMATVRTQIGPVYFYECLRKDHYTALISLLGCFEGAMGIIGSLYFIFWSKNWFGLIFSGFMLQIIAMLGSFFLVESPRWLIKKGRI